jgi:transposase-like protein
LLKNFSGKSMIIINSISLNLLNLLKFNPILFYISSLYTINETLPTVLRYPKEIKQFIYTTDQFERLAKEIKRRIKDNRVFPDEGLMERLLYLILKELYGRLNSKRLRGFNEIEWRK